MLKSAGCTYCIIGHSERRDYFHETDEDQNKKAKALVAAGLVPVFCCGESLEVREAGTYVEHVVNQVKAGLAGLEITCPKQVVVAYEPIWAIGTGKTLPPRTLRRSAVLSVRPSRRCSARSSLTASACCMAVPPSPATSPSSSPSPTLTAHSWAALRSRLPTSLYGRQGRRVGHMAQRHLPALLIIMDGCGLAPADGENAVAAAKTPFLDGLYEKYPHTTLGASGEDVGLPDGQMGNSEVGHLNIGAGRIVFQELSRINNAIKDGSIAKNEVFVKAMDDVKADGKTLHLMGLMSLAVFILT